jgi:hypothetical protein
MVLREVLWACARSEDERCLTAGKTACNNDYKKQYELILISTKPRKTLLYVTNRVSEGYCPSLFCFIQITFTVQAGILNVQL